MALKTVRVEELGLETRRIVQQAGKRPVLVRTAGGQTLVLRALSSDDLADELLVTHPKFKESVRRARRNRAAGKGVPLKQAMHRLGQR